MAKADSMQDNRNFFYAFMNAHKLCAISTTHDNGRPEAAVIGFGQTPELEIVFGTDNTSRKYQNLMRDGHVAFAIGWENGETLQYEGEARELASEELHLVDECYLQKSPESAKFRNNPNNRYFIVRPSWVRYTNLKNPQDTREIVF